MNGEGGSRLGMRATHPCAVTTSILTKLWVSIPMVYRTVFLSFFLMVHQDCQHGLDGVAFCSDSGVDPSFLSGCLLINIKGWWERPPSQTHLPQYLCGAGRESVIGGGRA